MYILRIFFQCVIERPLVFFLFQVTRLEKLLNDKESGLGSATSQITSLKEATDRLKHELNSTKNELTISKNKASSIDVSNFNCH